MQKMWNHWYYLSVQGGQDSLRDFVTRCSYNYKLRGKSQLIGSPINLRASNPTLEVKKKNFKPTIHNEANTGTDFEPFNSCLRAGFVS